MLISDWSSDVCSSDLPAVGLVGLGCIERQPESMRGVKEQRLRRDRKRDIRFADIKRSEERRVGKAWVRTCRSRWSSNPYKKTQTEYMNITRSYIVFDCKYLNK